MHSGGAGQCGVKRRVAGRPLSHIRNAGAKSSMASAWAQRLAALLLLLAVTWGAAGQPLQRSETYQAAFTGTAGQGVSVLASGVELEGLELTRTATNSPGGCAAACLDDEECTTFNWRCSSLEAECTDGSCTLLASSRNCTLAPPVAARGVVATAGFPLRELPQSLPGFTARPAAGINGDDVECPGSMLPGVCAFRTAVVAATVCAALSECRAVTYYAEGIDGCGEPVALLKRSILSPDNEFVAPNVYTLEITERTAISSTYLQNGQATVVLPDDASASLETVSGIELANSSVWLGCIVAENAVMRGRRVAVLDGISSAEQCCRVCREWPDGECNVFNYCSQPAGCSYEEGRTAVKLQNGECQLLHQQLVEPQFGWPPAVLAKGEQVLFTGGSPIAVSGPQVPGFTQSIARGLFGQPGFSCNETLAPMLNECYLSEPLPQLAATCLEDDQCQAFVYKPAGFFLSAKDAAYFRREDGANLVASVFTPTSILYARADATTAADGSSGSSGLSAGAAAGIAIGAVVLAAAVLGGGWVLFRRHRRSVIAASSASQLGKPGLEVGSDQSKLADGPDSHPSTQSSTLPSGALPPQHPLLGGLHSAQQAAYLRQQRLLVEQQGRQLDVSEPLPDTQPVPQLRLDRLDTALLGRRSTDLKASGWSGWASTRPVLPSPFAAAAMRQSHPLDAAGSAQLSPVSGGTGSAATLLVSDEDRSEVVEELLQHRAMQEAAELTGSLASTASGGRSSGSGGAGSALTMSQLLAALPPALQQWVVPRSELEYMKKPDGSVQLLGEGASGRVVKARFNGEEVAVKEIKLDMASEVRNAFVAEAARLNSLRHAHILTFYGVSWDEANSTGCIITEFCSGRDLQSVLQLRSARSGERIFGWWRSGRRIAVEVAKALAYLHRQGIVHMDIKSSNVLLTATGSAKLADVGVSRMQTRTYLSESMGVVGTWAWIAPEVLMGCRCTLSVDLYSFGVLLWEIATGDRPVRGQLLMPEVPEQAPQELVDLMQDCMSLDAASRPTAQQALQRLQELAVGRSR